MKLLEGKTAIVTGASRGIGKAVAMEFARQGANIAFTDLRYDEIAQETEKEIGNDFTAAQSLTKGITQQMFTELTKGADVHTPTITPEMISAAVTQSAAGMDGVQKEALDKFGQALTEFLQSTLDHAQEKQNADPEQ